MPQDENGNYTDLSEERKEHFWNYFTITSPIDPETHLEAWPDTVFKQKYMPIFPLPSFTNIVKEEPMNLTVYTRSSLFSWQNRLSMHSWDLDQFSKECGLMPINYKDFVFPPGEITDDVEKKYRALRETILVFHITDRGFERGSRNGDCFDLKFFNSVNGQTATHAQVWNGDKVRVPDLVTRDFLNDVARYVEREENMWDNLPNEEYWKWHNSFVRDAVLRELLHASVRKFRYMNDLGELEPLLEWVHERCGCGCQSASKRVCAAPKNRLVVFVGNVCGLREHHPLSGKPTAHAHAIAKIDPGRVAVAIRTLPFGTAQIRRPDCTAFRPDARSSTGARPTAHKRAAGARQSVPLKPNARSVLN
jgi:hypothetical protein